MSDTQLSIADSGIATQSIGSVQTNIQLSLLPVDRASIGHK